MFPLRSGVAGRGTASRTTALAALFLFAACAGAQKPQREEIVWPLPPNKPRVRHVRPIWGPEGFETGLWPRLLRLIGVSGGENRVFNPSGVALSVDEQTLYVASGIASHVLAFDFARHKVRRVADTEGHAPKYPYAVAVDGDGRLYVTDQKDAVVWVYSRENEFLSRIGSGMLVRPTGIAIDRKRRLVYVVDPGTRAQPRHVVEVFAPDGRRLRTIGSRGEDPGQFMYPTFAAVSPDGNLYVADTMNARVQVFDPEGALVTVFGTLGDALGQFAKPTGIAFDSLGNVHVADSQLGYVQIFDPKHRLLMHYGEKALLPEFMQLPNGLAINAKNEIFVADYAANHVNEYVLFDTSPAEPEKAPAPASAPPAPPPTSPQSAPQ